MAAAILVVMRVSLLAVASLLADVSRLAVVSLLADVRIAAAMRDAPHAAAGSASRMTCSAA